MNNNFKVFIFFLVLCLLPLKLNAGEDLSFPDSGVTISMDFQDADLKDILKIFSIQSGLNFIASEAVQNRKITLFLDKVPVQGVMDKLFKANNLTYELDEAARIFIVKDWGKPEVETVTKVFYLKYATVSSSSITIEMDTKLGTSRSTTGTTTGEGGAAGTTTTGEGGAAGITQAVKKILSKDGSVIEDYRTNSLIVIDIPSRMPIVAQTIALLDVPMPQVMLEVEMLDVSKNTVDQLGFEFGESPFTFILPGGLRGAKFFMGAIGYKGKTDITSGSAGSVVFGRTYAQILDFLRTQTDTKTLARPRLLTLNNEIAEIKITTDEVIGEKLTYDERGIISAREAERKATGVFLRVTPQINLETGEITMFINPSVDEAAASAFGASYRDPEKRETKSLVKVRDGETVILGGLIRNQFNQTIIKLPLLGDIPFIGVLFRHKYKPTDKQRELIVFITPHIVKDTSLGLASAKKAKLPIREQGTGSAPERQMAINTTLNNFEKIK